MTAEIGHMTPYTYLQTSVRAEAGERDIEALRFVVYSPAFQAEFTPFLERLIARWIDDILNPSETRKNLVPDDYLRGGIAVARALLSFPQALIAEDDREKAHEAEGAAVEAHYTRLARDGRPAPLEGPLPAEPVG